MKNDDVSLPSYFGYLGSKSGMADELTARMPPEMYVAYMELCAGGLGCHLRKRKARVNILNDLDADVIGTHAAVAAQPRAVMREMEKLRPCRRTFERLRDLRDCAGWHALSPAIRAAYFIYITKCSVNGNMRSFSNSAKSRSTFNPHYDLRPYGAKLDGATFENLHWKECIERFVLKPKEITLGIYADPPYVTSDTEKHYRFNFNRLEHLQLARVLTLVSQRNDGKRRNVKIMISYDDDPDGYIRSLYRPEFGWTIETIDVRYESEHRANQCRNELLIMNYDPASIQSVAAPVPMIDWSDMPAVGATIGGVPFSERTCCDKERLSRALQAKPKVHESAKVHTGRRES